MKIIKNKIIPFPGYKAINLFGVVFCRTDLSEIDKNHEAIHTKQMKEMLYIPFYLWYFGEYIVRLFGKGNAYRNISFEQEAYSNEKDMNYLKNRKHFSWFNYLKKHAE